MEGKGPPGSSGERERGRARAEPHCSEEAVLEASPGAGVQTEYLWPQGSGGPAVEPPAGPFPQGRSQDSPETSILQSEKGRSACPGRSVCPWFPHLQSNHKLIPVSDYNDACGEFSAVLGT